MFTALSLWESEILLWIQTCLRTPITDPIVSLFTQLGNGGALFILLTLALLLHPRTRKVGLAVALGLLCSLLFTNLCLKLIFQRVRPWVEFPALLPLVAEADPNSFPSGHTSAAFAFALAVCRCKVSRGVRVAVVVLAVLMGLSRLYVGVHYPSDVLVGFLVGDLAGLTGWYLSQRLVERWQQRQHTTP